MADDVLLNAGSGGETLATDQDAGESRHYQIVKLADGTANGETRIASGNGVSTNALRVTVSSDSTGVLSIDDNGGSITIDNADITSIKTAVEIIDNAVSGAGFNITQLGGVNVNMGEGIIATGTQRVTLATDDDGVAHLATIAGDTTSLDGKDFATQTTLSAINAKLVTGTVIGDVNAVQSGTWTVDLGANNDVTTTGNVAHDAADSGDPVKIGGKAYAFDGTAPQTAVAEADRVNAIFTPEGRQYVETSHPRYFNASADYAVAQTNATVQAAPGAGVKLYITDVIVSNGATAGNVTLLDGSGGSVLLELYPAINGGLTHSFRTPIALTANTLLAITSTTVTTHSVTVSGYIAA